VTTASFDALYTPQWRRKRRWIDEWSTRALLATFAHFGVPDTLLDVGCGDGHLVATAARLGTAAVGVDLSVADHEEHPRATLRRADLTKPLDLALPNVWSQTTPPVFDMVLCWETAEHLPESASDQLVATLALYAARHGILVFTAAVPGQGGVGHFNEQPPEYWAAKLSGAGFRSFDAEPLRRTWTSVCGPCQWYARNLQLFRRSAK
jgi:protein-L-isoaspartate O-methyltransferase